MNPRYRFVYLLLGFIGLAYLAYYVITTFTESSDVVNPGFVLLITVPDMVFFFLAYKTYPAENEMKRSRQA